MSTTTTTDRDKMIATANSMPDLIAKATVLDPALAKALQGQAQQASATPIGGLIAGAIALAAAHFGLNWGQQFDDLIAGVFVLAGGYAVHWWQARAAKGVLAAPVKAA